MNSNGAVCKVLWKSEKMSNMFSCLGEKWGRWLLRLRKEYIGQKALLVIARMFKFHLFASFSKEITFLNAFNWLYAIGNWHPSDHHTHWTHHTPWRTMALNQLLLWGTSLSQTKEASDVRAGEWAPLVEPAIGYNLCSRTPSGTHGS